MLGEAISVCLKLIFAGDPARELLLQDLATDFSARKRDAVHIEVVIAGAQSRQLRLCDDGIR